MNAGIMTHSPCRFYRSVFYKIKETKRTATAKKRRRTPENHGNRPTVYARSKIGKDIADEFSEFMEKEFMCGGLSDKQTLYEKLSRFAREHRIENTPYAHLISALPDPIFARTKRLYGRSQILEKKCYAKETLNQ